MRLSGIALLFAVPLAAAACARSTPQPTPLGPLPVQARLLYDNTGGIRDSGQVVIRDANALNDTWRRATSTQSSPPAVPAVDFTKDMVLMVSGGRMSPSNEIHVDSAGVRKERTAAGKEQDVLAVHYTITEGCTRVNRDAYPVEMVRVRRWAGEVRFMGRRERAICR